MVPRYVGVVELSHLKAPTRVYVVINLAFLFKKNEIDMTH